MPDATSKIRIAYLECFAGISGDMLLGALLDAGVDPAILHQATASLKLNATLKIEKVDRSGISATKVHVLENDTLTESKHTHPHSPADPHPEARSLTAIRTLIQSADLSAPVKQTAIRTFELLGAAEAKIHNVDIEHIHFHEVGAVDAIVDIVAASAGIHALNSQAIAETAQPLQWYCSPLNVGGGMVDCAHGRFPVPAPATADLLRGLPTYSAHIQKELVTPTGAALIRAIDPAFGPQPAMLVQNIGYGAGTRNPKDLPNVLRLSIGNSTISGAPFMQLHRMSGVAEASQTSEPIVTVLETALDDLSPQIIAYVAEQALALGALDVMLTPVLMKKGRPGTLITILCDEAHSTKLQQLLLRETTTLGIRIRQDRRITLDRAHVTVSTPYGDIRIKVGSSHGEELNATPEFEDCRAAASTHNVPVKQVTQAAIAAYIPTKAQEKPALNKRRL